MEETIKEGHLGTVLGQGWAEVEWDKVVIDLTLRTLEVVSPTMEVFMEAMIEVFMEEMTIEEAFKEEMITEEASMEAMTDTKETMTKEVSQEAMTTEATLAMTEVTQEVAAMISPTEAAVCWEPRLHSWIILLDLVDPCHLTLALPNHLLGQMSIILSFRPQNFRLKLRHYK